MQNSYSTINLYSKEPVYPWDYLQNRLLASLTVLSILLGIIACLTSNYFYKSNLIYLFIILGIILFFVILVKPRTGYFLAVLLAGLEHVALYPVIHQKQVYFFLVPSTLLIIITLIGWCLNKYSKIYNPRESHPLDIPLLCLVILGGFSILWSYSIPFAFYWWLMLIMNFMFYYLATALVTDRDILQKVCNFLILAGIFMSIGSIISFLWQTSYVNTYTYGEWNFTVAFRTIYRRAGGFAGSNHTAGFINLAMGVVAANLFYTKKDSKKLFYGILILIFLYGVVLTQSRAGTVSSLFILSLTTLIFLPWRKNIFRNMFLIFMLLVTVILIADISNLRGKSFFGRISSGVQGTEPASVSGIGARIKWWGNGLDTQIKNDDLLLGMGLGGFLWNVDEAPEVHSVYLCYLFELGVPGVIILMTIILILIPYLYKILNIAIKHRTYTNVMFLGLFSSFCGTVVLHGLIEYDFYMRTIWFILGLLLAVGHLVLKEHSSTIQDKS